MLGLTTDQLNWLKSMTDPVWIFRIIAESTAVRFGGTYDGMVYFSRPHSFSSIWSNHDSDTGAMDLAKIKEIEYQARSKKRGGMASVASARWSISNDAGHGPGQHEQFLWNNDYHYDGRRVEIYVCDSSETDYTEAIKVFSGKVEEIDYTPDWIEFRAEGADGLYRTQLPPNLYAQDNADVWSDDKLSGSIIGKAVPMVFGDLLKAEGYTVSDTNNVASVDNGQVVQFCDPEIGTINNISSVLFGDSGLEDCSNGVAEIDTASGRSPWTADVPNGTIYFDGLLKAELYLKMLVKLRSYTENTANTNGVTNHKNALDEDPSSFAYVPGAGLTDNAKNLTLKIPPIGLAGVVTGSSSSSTTGLEIYLVAKMIPQVYAWSTGDPNFIMWGASVENGVASISGMFFYCPSWMSSSSVQIDNWDSEANWEDYRIKGEARVGYGTASLYQNLSDYGNGFLHLGSGTFPISSVAGFSVVNMAALFMKFYIDWPRTGFLANVKGYEDDASGSYTGNPNSLAENPAHLIGLIFGEFTEAGAANVDTTELKAMAAFGGSRYEWKFANQLMEQDDVSRIVDELAEEASIWVWLDHNGKIRAFPMVVPTPAGSISTISESHVIDGQLMSRKLSPSKDVFTDFTIKYDWNPVTDEYSKSIVCNATDYSDGLTAESALCLDAEERYTGGHTYDVTYELDWIHDDDTALAAASEIITRDTRRRWDIIFEADISSMNWELGDAVGFELLEWPQLPQNVKSAIYRFTGKRIIPVKNRIRYTITEVV